MVWALMLLRYKDNKEPTFQAQHPLKAISSKVYNTDARVQFSM